MLLWKPERLIGFPMEQKDIIIECAIRCFEKQGLHFTMQDIASELHIAKKTIYALFPGKDILLCAMLEKGYAGIHEDKRRILDSDLKTLDKIREVMIAMPAQYQLIDFRQLKLLEEKYPVVYEKLIGYLEADWEPVIELIENAKKEGLIRDVPISIIRSVFTASVESFIFSGTLEKENITFRDAMNQLIDILLSGIRKDHYEKD